MKHSVSQIITHDTMDSVAPGTFSLSLATTISLLAQIHSKSGT